MIADQQLLDTYTFFTERHVFLRQDNEDEAAAMYRITGMPEAEILAKRAALVELRAQLNTRSTQLFAEYFKEAGL